MRSLYEGLMNQTVVFGLALAVAAGACLAVQAGVNGKLAKGLGSPVLSALASFAVGTLALAVFVGALRMPVRTALSQASSTPFWVWLFGGVLGAFYVVSIIYLAPRLGAATTLGGVVAGQMLASLALDHYGALSFPEHAISWPRIVGAGLIAGSVVLVRAT